MDAVKLEENDNCFVEASVRIISYSTFHDSRFQEISPDLIDTFKNDDSAVEEDSEQGNHNQVVISHFTVNFALLPLGIVFLERFACDSAI